MSEPTAQAGMFQRIVVPAVGAALCLASIPVHAGRPTPIIEQFAARAVTIDGPEKRPINIYIEQWSSVQDVEALRRPMLSGTPGDLLPALERQPRPAAIILMPGVQGLGARVLTRTPKSMFLARDEKTATGRRVILASAEHLGFGEDALASRESFREFNLVEIRFDRNGTGVGKVVSADRVDFAKPRMLEIKDFGTQPASLVDVRAEKK